MASSVSPITHPSQQPQQPQPQQPQPQPQQPKSQQPPQSQLQPTSASPQISHVPPIKADVSMNVSSKVDPQNMSATAPTLQPKLSLVETEKTALVVQPPKSATISDSAELQKLRNLLAEKEKIWYILSVVPVQLSFFLSRI